MSDFIALQHNSARLPSLGDRVIFRHYDGQEYAAFIIGHPTNNFLDLHVLWRTQANPLIFGVPYQQDLYSYGWRRHV